MIKISVQRQETFYKNAKSSEFLSSQDPIDYHGSTCCQGRWPFLLEKRTLKLVMILGSDPSISSLLLSLSCGDLYDLQSRLHHAVLSNNSSIKTSLIEVAMCYSRCSFYCSVSYRIQNLFKYFLHLHSPSVAISKEDKC
jgi:hypothetical protein